jgi:hypothetical protein
MVSARVARDRRGSSVSAQSAMWVSSSNLTFLGKSKAFLYIALSVRFTAGTPRSQGWGGRLHGPKP